MIFDILIFLDRCSKYQNIKISKISKISEIQKISKIGNIESSGTPRTSGIQQMIFRYFDIKISKMILEYWGFFYRRCERARRLWQSKTAAVVASNAAIVRHHCSLTMLVATLRTSLSICAEHFCNASLVCSLGFHQLTGYQPVADCCRFPSSVGSLALRSTIHDIMYHHIKTPKYQKNDILIFWPSRSTSISKYQNIKISF